MSRDICVYVDFLNDARRDKITRTAQAGGMTVHFFDPGQAGQFEQAVACGRNAEVLYSNSPALFKECKNLNWYCCSFAGVDVFCKDSSLFPNDHCMLTNSNVYGLTIAEHTIMVALMLLRNMPVYTRKALAHDWSGLYPMRSIHGLCPVLLGTGQIGSNIAQRMRALGAAKIIGVNRSGRAAPDFDEVYPIDRFDELLPTTEMLIMAVPSTGETAHVLNRERIALLPENALIINVGRGTAVDQDALAEALNAQRIAGAALDVAVPEPLPADHPLWDAKNLIITPHVSGNMTLPYTCDRNVDSFCEDLANYMAGKPLAHLVDRKKGY